MRRSYFWSHLSNGAHLKGVAIGISRYLQPFVKVTPGDVHIMQVRLQCTLGFMSHIIVVALTKILDTEVVFDAKVNSISDCYFPWDTDCFRCWH